MPRLSSSLLRHAARVNAHLPRLLRECRDLESATNELRWLTEHAYDDYNNHHHHDNHHRVLDTNYRRAKNARAGADADVDANADITIDANANATATVKVNAHAKAKANANANARLRQFVRRRASGEPLQYILGSQPFGELDVLCRKNVLIPRPETETYTVAVAEVLKRLQREGVLGTGRPIRIADLCTGTGCIALLLHRLLCSGNSDAEHFHPFHPFHPLEILGVDISSHALKLARKNLKYNIDAGLLDVSCSEQVSFGHADLLDLGRVFQTVSSLDSFGSMAAAHHDDDSAITRLSTDRWDVVISNPPYISPVDYAPGGTVSRSVRDHEPKLALVPPPRTIACGLHNVAQADQFYEAVLSIAQQTEAKLVVMEVGDSQQAHRVRELAAEFETDKVIIETWRDDGSVVRSKPTAQLKKSKYTAGLAHERAVVIWKSSWADWRLKS